MLKHVHSSTTSLFRCGKPIAKDSLSLNSTISLSSGSNSANLELASSRSSSTCSLHDSLSLTGSPQKPQVKKVMVKVYARVLCSDIEYKTLCIDGTTSAQQVIMMLLQKFKMKHRDPNLYYLTMEVWMRSTGIPIRTIMVLDDEARPAELQACHPKGESKFLLQMRRGGLIKVYDSCLMAGSLYKSLLVSEKTTAEQVVQLVLHCYNAPDRPSKYALFLVSHTSSYERMVYPQEIPLKLQQDWPSSQRLAFHLRSAQPAPSCPSTWSTGSTGSNSSASSTLSTESAASMQSVFNSCPAPKSVVTSHSHNHSLTHQLSEPRRHGPLLTPQDVFIHRLRSSRSSVELSSSGTSSHSSSPSPSIAVHGPTKSQPTVYNPYENCFYI
ncbi:uncharacterized protein LOC100901866 [Galendromus occidentalis]|uniref:Uncharacterized protein LOC100901866 n=1 Tax=Galendromus occidentalis TaxID=34638 RepID=A0AAJ7SDJ6_9ACAR|nr:uncharacterized protein LOC100901866 [Galendromus occidentalis]